MICIDLHWFCELPSFSALGQNHRRRSHSCTCRQQQVIEVRILNGRSPEPYCIVDRISTLLAHRFRSTENTVNWIWHHTLRFIDRKHSSLGTKVALIFKIHGKCEKKVFGLCCSLAGVTFRESRVALWRHSTLCSVWGGSYLGIFTTNLWCEMGLFPFVIVIIYIFKIRKLQSRRVPLHPL